MSKKHFIALADAIRIYNSQRAAGGVATFTLSQIETIADFCAAQNPRFNRFRWMDYVAGICGPNGGKIK